MTNEEMIQDLKQFIAGMVSQAVSQSEDRIKANLDRVKTELEERISNLDVKVDLIQDAIAEAISHTNESIDGTLQDHEQRLCRLEQQAA